jgi:hypothetical protein
MKLRIHSVLLALLCASCGGDPAGTPAPDLNALVDQYLLLELSMGKHDPGHVDAYFGPQDIRDDADKKALSIQEIEDQSNALILQLSSWPESDSDPMQAARIEGLSMRLNALNTRIALGRGETLPFDDEALILFGTTAPDHDSTYFEGILAEIDALLPGDGDLSQRVNDFRNRFVIPPDRLSAVFDAAIAECRRRTLEKIELPANESFLLEYVTDKPWSGYNWYQGNAQSLIQINTDLPTFISRAVDLGCHEGYPGHHTFNALLEHHLVKQLGWNEFSLYPLFSPMSLIAEGSGNYGIELAFPGDERVQFERDVLFPLASLDAAEADRYYALEKLLGRLNYAGNEAARDYLNGTIDGEAAEQWLIDYTMSSPERAAQRLQFIETYRSYVINYNLGKDMVRDYVERDAANQDDRWRRFTEMLSTPVLPQDLQ